MDNLYGSLIDRIDASHDNIMLVVNSNHDASMAFKQDFKHDTEQWRVMHDARQEKQNELIMALQVTIITLTANVNNLTNRVETLEIIQKQHAVKLESIGKYTIKDLFILVSSLSAFVFMLIDQFFKYKK
jgi:hypothetical protein